MELVHTIKNQSIKIKTFSNSKLWQSQILLAIEARIQEIQNDLCGLNEFLNIVVSGGNTPIPIYRNLHSLKIDWSRIKFWLADERCVAIEHQDSNFRQVFEAISENNLCQVDFIPMVDGNPSMISKKYLDDLKNVNVFSLAILGIGEDGHTASLFPGNDLGEFSDSPAAISVTNSPKPPAHRITLSLSRINQTNHVIFLVSGSSKKETIERVLAGENLPAAKVNGKKSTIIYYLMENS